jgi:hypothetical protein
MPVKIEHVSCSDDDLQVCEGRLIQAGFCLVTKTNEKDLAIGEYTKSSSGGKSSNFGGERIWLLTARHE